MLQIKRLFSLPALQNDHLLYGVCRIPYLFLHHLKALLKEAICDEHLLLNVSQESCKPNYQQYLLEYDHLEHSSQGQPKFQQKTMG